jgi:hypothetical protein
MSFARVIFVALVSLSGALPTIAAPALFWISDSPDDPKGPAAPTILAPQGQERTLYIWAQPETGKILQGFSLDLVIPPHVLNGSDVMPVVDFLDNRFTVYNPCVLDCQTADNQKPRFQDIYDSSGSPPYFEKVKSNFNEEQILAGSPDGLGGRDQFGVLRPGRDLQGLSVSTTGFVGIGHPNDPLKRDAANGPAWLVASIGFQTVRSSGSNDYYLQVGFTGMLHQGDEDTMGTEIVFGDNLSPSFPYDVGKLGGEDNKPVDRQFTSAGDRFDVRITAIEMTNVPGDYNGNGVVGPEDYGIWRSTFGMSVTSGGGADGNGNGVVDAADYAFWRNKLSTPAAARTLDVNALAASQSINVPESSTIVLSYILLLISGLSCRARL